tara:strand:- start:721 stop:1218 length:498 start_codon:yes stop_codon:yes gene_type:complete
MASLIISIIDEIAEVGDNEAMLPEDGPASFMSVVGPATPLMLKTAFLESRYKEQVRVCMDVMKEEVSGPAFEEAAKKLVAFERRVEFLRMMLNLEARDLYSLDDVPVVLCSEGVAVVDMSEHPLLKVSLLSLDGGEDSEPCPWCERNHTSGSKRRFIRARPATKN